MPCSYVIDKEHRLVITSAWDRVTFAEVRRHQETLMADPAFDPTFNQLVDATAATAIDASIEEIKRVASRHFFSAMSRRAFVAAKPEVFAVGRLLGAYVQMGREGEFVNVFYDLPSALKWLGLEQDPRRS